MVKKASPKPKAAPVEVASGPAPEVVKVHTHRLACDGVGGALGHPRVWLELGSAGEVDCPYCDRRFVLASGKAGHETPGVYEAVSH